MGVSLPSSEWVTLLKPLCAGNLTDVNHAITSHPTVQEWMRQRVLLDARSLVGGADLMAINSVYAGMQDDFRSDFKPLFEAIATLAEGVATLEIEWDPFEPRLSRIRVAFPARFPIHAFRVLDHPGEDDTRAAIGQLARLMPASEPFPSHPHVLGAALIHSSHQLPLKLVDSVQNRVRTKRIHLEPEGLSVKAALSLEEAPAAVVEYFRFMGRKS